MRTPCLWVFEACKKEDATASGPSSCNKFAWEILFRRFVLARSFSLELHTYLKLVFDGIWIPVWSRAMTAVRASARFPVPSDAVFRTRPLSLARNPLGDKKICSIKRDWHGFIVLRLCGEKALSTHITAVEFFVLSIDPLLMMITIQRRMTQWSSGCLLYFHKSWLQYIWSCFYRHAAHCIGEQPRESLCSRVD